MQVEVLARSKFAAPLAALAESRVRFMMRRREAVVPTATVRLSDVNGPRGGADKQCHVALRTNGNGTIVASATATTWRAAIHAALARAVHLLARLAGKGRGKRKTALPAPVAASSTQPG